MTQPRPASADSASFRDPSGFIYRNDDGRLCRQINAVYAEHFRQLHDSGLYDDLVKDGLMVEHEGPEDVGDGTSVIYPREIPFISYPYEWSFTMLKDAALLTLEIQKRALAKGQVLKDATAYNVQFDGAKPVFIDTLSFEPLQEGKPWIAYGQFCRHFLAPLTLMSRRDIRLGSLLRNFIDGVPLDLAVKMLPRRAFLNLGAMLHLYLHSKSVGKHQQTGGDASATKAREVKVSKASVEQMADHLASSVSKLQWQPVGTEWVDYYQDNTYTEAMNEDKTRWIADKLKELKPNIVWDLGANTGLYSRVARDAGAFVASMDIDPGCVERNYLEGKKREERKVLPLCLDLANPSPGLGWAHQERRAITERGPADAALALALIHHLSLGNNVPFPLVAQWFAKLTRRLLIEFVPKDDPQSQRLLSSREDVFADYTQEKFEEAFGAHFRQIENQQVGDSGRVLYLFEALES